MKVFRELEFELEYDYTPEQARRHDCPGADEEVSLTQVKLNGVDITDAITASPDTLEIFEDSCLEDAHSRGVDRAGEREDYEYERTRDRELEGRA